jgi:hypothetical protein
VKDVILVDNASSKKYVRCDVIIEDRPENLIGFPLNVSAYILDTPYRNKSDHPDARVFPNWGVFITDWLKDDYNDFLNGVNDTFGRGRF